jgi:hypothetical protein
MADDKKIISSNSGELPSFNTDPTSAINATVNKKKVEEEFARLSKDFYKAWGDDMHRWEIDAANTWEKDFVAFLYGRYLIVNQLYRIFDNHGVGIDQLAYHLGASFASFLDELKKTSTRIEMGFIKNASINFEREVRRGFLERQELLGHKGLLQELYDKVIDDYMNEANTNVNVTSTTTSTMTNEERSAAYQKAQDALKESK